MPSFRTFDLSDMVVCGAALRKAASASTSFEEAAQAVVAWLYDELMDEDGRDCVLVRFYRTQRFSDLDPSVQEFARAASLDGEVTDSTKCLTLLATRGNEPDWNDPRRSQGHQAIPLQSATILQRSPMIAQLVHQLGIDVASFLDPDPALVLEADEKTYNVFYVGEATGSPHIPAQTGFVDRYGIRSALGFGGMLPTGDLFSVILFATTFIPAETAELFASVALSVKVAILPFAEEPVLTASDSGAPSPRVLSGRPRSAAIEQLLKVQEQAALEQSARLAVVHAAERRRSAQLQQLARASLTVNSTLSVEEILRRVTEQARAIIGAHQAVASTTNLGWAQAITHASLSETYAAFQGYEAAPDGSGIYALVCETNQPMRLTQAQLLAHPRWRAFGAAAADHPPMRGWLAAPLTARNGSNLGLIQLSDPLEEQFTAEDEAILVQLAALASVSIENARQYQQERGITAALQHSLLTQPPTPEHLSIAVRYQPAAREAQIGGDWYDAFLTAAGDTMIVVGDVNGHDRVAAATMGQVRNLLRGLAYDSADSTATLLHRLDGALAGLQLNTLVTVLLARVEEYEADRARGVRRLRWSNAGHPPPLLRQPDGEVRLLDSRPELLLGVDPTARRTEHTVELAAGATLLLYTDGLIERRNAPLDDGIQRLSDALATRGGGEPEQVCDALLTACLTQNDNDDDVALLALRTHSHRAKD